MHKLLIFNVLIFSSLANESFVLDEKSLVQMAKESSPRVNLIEASALEANVRDLKFKENFGFNFVGEQNFQDSDEAAISTVVPVFGPTKLTQLGVQKGTKYGVGVSANIFTNQQSTNNGLINNQNRTGYNIQFSMDLWKNLFGSISKNTTENLSLLRKQYDYESKVSKESYYIDLRKIYWSLVANEESLKVTNQLYDISKRQLVDISRRQRNKIADRGDVARIKAQVASRKATITALEFQRESMLRIIKSQLSLALNKDLKIQGYDIDGTIGKVMACIDIIGKQEKVPWDHTYYDEIVDLVKMSYEKTQKITDQYARPDLTLKGEYQRSGVGQGFSNSYDNYDDDSKGGGAIALELSVPLDGKKSKSKSVQEILDRKRYLASRENYRLMMEANHEQILKSIKLLQNVVAAQQENGKNLEISLRVSERKYKQARISLNDFINEQNLFFQSKLSEIDAQLAVINEILDYLKVFTLTPCELNRV